MGKMDFCLKPYRILYGIEPGKVTLFTVSTIVNQLYTPVQLFLTKAIIDSFQYGDMSELYTNAVMFTLLLAALMMVTGLVFGNINAMALSILIDRGELEKERMAVEKSVKLRLQDAESPSVADLREKAAKASVVQTFQDAEEFMGRALLILLLLVILTVNGHWGLTLGTCAVTGLSMLIYIKSSAGMEGLNRKKTGDKRMMEYLFDLLTGKQSVREIRVFGAAAYLKEKKYSIFKKYKSETVRQGIKSEGLRLMPDMVMAVAGGILAAAIALITGSKWGTAGDFVVLFQAATMLYSSLPGFVALAGNLKTAAIRWNDLEIFLNLEEEEKSGKKDIARVSNLEVEADGLTFKYPGASKPAVNNVSFKIPAGCKVAIVGENGSGKSTLVKLLIGLYRPERGCVRWRSGKKEIPVSQIRHSFSAVFQDYARFNLTIRENVALGDIGLLNDDAELKRALYKAQSRSEAEMLDIRLGAGFGGIELSGGQWQRLATSRAYLHDGVFIFFDEPTAALDPKAEERAFDTFINMTRGKSAVLVTHRLGAVRLTDYILVLKDGELVEQGIHEELVEAGGEYARMYEMQASWYNGKAAALEEQADV